MKTCFFRNTLASKALTKVRAAGGLGRYKMASKVDDKGDESARSMKKSVAAEERRIEAAKGSPLAKGPERVKERAASAVPKDDRSKQKG